MAPADEDVVELGRDDAAVGDRDVGELGRGGGGDADLVVVADGLAPLVHRHLVRADEPARVAHAELGRGEHQPRVLEAGRVAAEELEVRGHAPARLDLHRGEVGDLQAAVAGQARAHEEPDVVAPAGVRRLEVAELLVAALEQRAVRLGVRALPRDPLGEVDARPRPRRVDAVLDVGALALDVGLVGARRRRRTRRGRRWCRRRPWRGSRAGPPCSRRSRRAARRRRRSRRRPSCAGCSRAPTSSSSSTDSYFSHSGSIIGDHVTTSRKALRRSRQCATGSASREPQCSWGAPATASAGRRSRISEAKPVMIWRPPSRSSGRSR